VRLVSNLNFESVVVASVNASEVTTSALFSCTLDPAVGDADFGSPAGLPIGVVAVGDEFFVPVCVNTGASLLGSFEFVVTFNGALLRVLEVLQSFSGLMDSTVSSGVLRIAGAVDMSHVSGSAVEVVGVRLSGTIESLSQWDLAGTLIGSGLVRPIVAGPVDFDI